MSVFKGKGYFIFTLVIAIIAGLSLGLALLWMPEYGALIPGIIGIFTMILANVLVVNFLYQAHKTGREDGKIILLVAVGIVDLIFLIMNIVASQ